MKRSPLARLVIFFLALTLFAGVQAKAIGVGSCPMHQAAAHEHHDGHAHGKTVACNCLDACQTGGHTVLASAEGFRVAGFAAPAEPETPSVEIRAAVAVRAHLLPFPNPPPFLS